MRDGHSSTFILGLKSFHEKNGTVTNAPSYKRDTAKQLIVTCNGASFSLQSATTQPPCQRHYVRVISSGTPLLPRPHLVQSTNVRQPKTKWAKQAPPMSRQTFILNYVQPANVANRVSQWWPANMRERAVNLISSVALQFI